MELTYRRSFGQLAVQVPRLEQPRTDDRGPQGLCRRRRCCSLLLPNRLQPGWPAFDQHRWLRHPRLLLARCALQCQQGG